MLIDKDAAIAAIKRLEIDGPQLIWSSDAIDAVQGVEPDAPHVPDVGKVIRGLKECAKIEYACTKCPYKEVDPNVCSVKLLTDAVKVIEAQRRTLDEIDKYVRELDRAVNGNG